MSSTILRSNLVRLRIAWVGNVSRVLSKSLIRASLLVEEVSKERILLEVGLRHVSRLVWVKQRLVRVRVLIMIVLILLLLILALLWFSSATWEGHLFQEVAATPTFDEEFNSLSSAKEVLGFTKDQNVLLRNGVNFPLVSDVAHSLLAVVIVHNTMLDAFTVTVRRSLLTLDRFAVFVGDLARANTFFVDITFEPYRNVFVDAKHLVLADEVPAVKVNIALAVCRF